MLHDKVVISGAWFKVIQGASHDEWFDEREKVVRALCMVKCGKMARVDVIQLNISKKGTKMLLIG